MKIHFIAIGGNAMHNLALALHHKGEEVSGSDDEIFEPSRSRLAAHGLLPETIGWDPQRITTGIDAVVVGMHARADNPELIRAQELGLKLYSYPEYLYEQSKDKTRVVIAGSHGKTTITSMILHVMNYHDVHCDYMVGAQLEGFDTMVRISDEADFMVLEGDEYLASPLDRRPKFHLYKPNIALVSGIAWDHINVFPTFENYVEQFRIFTDRIEKGGAFIYCEEDEEVRKLAEKATNEIKKFPYGLPEHRVEEGNTFLETEFGSIPLQVFGEHNLMNIEGARWICNQMGVMNEQFYEAIASFSGASRRLEVIGENEHTRIYRDYAHAPSKVKAVVAAVREQYPKHKLVACLELHTFSSLNAAFLPHYKGSMDHADLSVVYFNPHTIAHKKLEPVTEAQVKEAFANESLVVITDSSQLLEFLEEQSWQHSQLLFMSSGNFDGLDLVTFSGTLV